MQSLREKIKLNLDQNLKNRDEIATSTVRLILAAIKDHDIQNRTKKKGEFISDEDTKEITAAPRKMPTESPNEDLMSMFEESSKPFSYTDAVEL